MAGWIKLLQYEKVAYWRHAFSVRGKYDASGGFLLLILAAFAFRYVSILKGAAKSLEGGEAENVSLIFAIVLLAWILPVLESQSVSAQTSKFLHLPLTKTELTLLSLAAVFLLPSSLISLVISLAAFYPLFFSKNISGNVVTLFLFVLLSAFANIAFFSLMKTRPFRIAAFISLIILAFLFFNGKLSFSLESEFLPAQTISRNITSENSFGNVFLLAPCLFAAILLAFFSVKRAMLASVRTNRILNPQLLSRVRFPVKYGELVKKDFIYAWKMPDCWLSLLASVFYAILLAAADFSFESFSVAISVIVMMSGILAFNVFGLENRSGIERLSLFPIKSEDLLRTKNKTFALVVFSHTFFLFPLLFFKFGAVSLVIAILKIVSIVLLYTAWGNYLSIKFPFSMRFYQFSFGGSPAAMIYGILVISLLVIAPEFLTAGHQWTKLLAGVFLIIFSRLIYGFSLRRNSPKLSENWNRIALKLS